MRECIKIFKIALIKYYCKNAKVENDLYEKKKSFQSQNIKKNSVSKERWLQICYLFFKTSIHIFEASVLFNFQMQIKCI